MFVLKIWKISFSSEPSSENGQNYPEKSKKQWTRFLHFSYRKHFNLQTRSLFLKRCLFQCSLFSQLILEKNSIRLTFGSLKMLWGFFALKSVCVWSHFHRMLSALSYRIAQNYFRATLLYFRSWNLLNRLSHEVTLHLVSKAIQAGYLHGNYTSCFFSHRSRQATRISVSAYNFKSTSVPSFVTIPTYWCCQTSTPTKNEPFAHVILSFSIKISLHPMFVSFIFYFF